MHKRVILITLAVLAVMLWAGLVFFMNYRPPSTINQVLFLMIWGTAVSCTMIPIAYVVNARVVRYPDRSEDVSLAIRRGSLIGLLAIILMTLRFLRLLSLLSGVLLVLLTLTVEVSLTLKRR